MLAKAYGDRLGNTTAIKPRKQSTKGWYGGESDLGRGDLDVRRERRRFVVRQAVAAAADGRVLLAADQVVLQELEEGDVGRPLAALAAPVGVDLGGRGVAVPAD